jgi:hypothetical protein
MNHSSRAQHPWDPTGHQSVNSLDYRLKFALEIMFIDSGSPRYVQDMLEMEQPRISATDCESCCAMCIGTKVLLWKFICRPLNKAKSSNSSFAYVAYSGDPCRISSVLLAYCETGSGAPFSIGCIKIPSL